MGANTMVARGFRFIDPTDSRERDRVGREFAKGGPGAAAGYMATGTSVIGSNSNLPDAPPPPPNATDEAIKAARRAEITRQLANRGRRSSFLTGPMGADIAATTGAPKRFLGS